ncbi:MAG TPA: YggT family protein [Gemmatimonadaceae bacterium]|nr:YggT family protein [Gemmatimonadaceae bacterium]
MQLLASYASLIAVVKTALLFIGVAVAAVCALDWAVRTRRISPFSRTARLMRARVDPMLRPIERVILRAGGVPSSAAWWGLVGYVVLALLLITLLQFIGGILSQIVFAAGQPSAILPLLLSWAFSFLRLALIVRVLSSWLPVSPHSRWIRWSYVTTDWMIRPLQRIVPRLGVFDITPLVAWFGLYLIQSLLGIP